MSRFIPIISVILLIIAIIGGCFFWWPKYQEFKKQVVLLEQVDKSLGKKNSYYLKLKETSNKLKTYKDEIDKIDSALPAKVSLPILFDYIEKMSINNKLVLNSISSSGVSSGNSGNSGQSLSSSEPTISSSETTMVGQGGKISAEPTGGVEKFLLGLSLTGTYPAFKNFLSAVYKSARFFEVKSISFSSPAEKDLFNFNLSLETYILPKTEIQKNEPESAGPVPAEPAR